MNEESKKQEKQGPREEVEYTLFRTDATSNKRIGEGVEIDMDINVFLIVGIINIS